MEWLNYHHLLYFWMVAKHGSVSAASDALMVSQPTISGQIRKLEQALGQKLFRKQGRGLVLTDVGRTCFDYAESIFPIGQELLDVIRRRPTGRAPTLRVGVTEHMPKLVTHDLLAPAAAVDEDGQPGMRLVVFENAIEQLLTDLSSHKLDLILADAPPPTSHPVRAFAHMLGECGVNFYAPPKLAAKLKRDFPMSLQDAPVMLPTDDNTLRRNIDRWLAAREIRPRIVGEFEDSALLKTFASQQAAAFPACDSVERAISTEFGVKTVGPITGVNERFYAVTVQRKIEHPGVLKICQAARDALMQEPAAVA